MDEFTYRKGSDLDHLSPVTEHFATPGVRKDMSAINEPYIREGIQNCVAVSVYSSLKFSGIAPEVAGDEVAAAFREGASKEGFPNLDIHLLVETLTGGNYTASLIDHQDYLANRAEIERRSSNALIADVSLNGTGERHVYAVLRSDDGKYHVVDDSLTERVLGDAIGSFIGPHRVIDVIPIHRKDVKLDDLCTVF